jgi:hypothetical protein
MEAEQLLLLEKPQLKPVMRLLKKCAFVRLTNGVLIRKQSIGLMAPLTHQVPTQVTSLQ